MKRFCRIYLFILINIELTCTIYGQDTIKSDSSNNNEKVQVQKTKSILKSPKINYSMELGAGYFAASKLFSGTYTSIAPSVNYLITPKLNVEVGGIFMTGNTNFNQNSVVKSNPNLAQNSNQYLVFANSQYLIGKKLMLTGSFYSTLNSGKTPQINPYFLNYKGMNLGLNYKVGEHMSIGAEFRLSNGYDNLFDNTGFNTFPHFGDQHGW